MILPALAAAGLLEAAAGIYARARAAFYGLASLVLTVVFAALVGEPRAEGLTRIDPADLRRLLGLDRAPRPAPSGAASGPSPPRSDRRTSS
ncbi:MAG: hypothetical protein ACRDZW_06780, partial [Acidimicrobiales bacterium]